jgi:glycosyltransferase involved in cell wall biosynthesis
MKSKVIVVMPAYNAALTVEKTVKEIPEGFADEIILVDDASKDDTVTIAKNLGLTVITHEKNMGYGANQKTCYDMALKRNADIIIVSAFNQECLCINTYQTDFLPLLKTWQQARTSQSGTQGIGRIRERFWKKFLIVIIRMILFLIHNFFFRQYILDSESGTCRYHAVISMKHHL